jgi:hypothetical protein
MVSFFKILIIFVLLAVPWQINDNSSIEPEFITSDLSFYETNTCDISLISFLKVNPNVVYQDHYVIRGNNYSAINCYGTITGIDQINDVFYISIGTNSIINLIIFSAFFLIIGSFMKNGLSDLKVNVIKSILVSLISSTLLVFGIYSEFKFYENSLYIFDLVSLKSYLPLLMIFFTINLLSILLYQYKRQDMLNYFPYIFVVIGMIQGFNLNFIFILLINIGLINFIRFFKNFKVINIYYMFLIFFWFTSARLNIQNIFNFKTDKIVGLTNSTYSSNSVLYWSLLIYLIIFGIYSLVKDSNEFLDWKRICNNLLVSSSLVFLLGLFSANFPLLRFFNFIYLGQQKPSSINKDILGVDLWGEVVAWRGFFPSAETVGELYGLTIIIFVFTYSSHKSYQLSGTKIFYLAVNILGLIASNNRSVFISGLAIILYFLYRQNTFNISKKIMKPALLLVVCFVLFVFVGSNNFSYPLEFTNNVLINGANQYTLSPLSSSFLYLSSIENLFLKFIFGFISTFSFFINRSEIWGIFIARFDPTINEFLFGSGPFTLSKLYSKIPVESTNGLILPHSSLLNLLVYIGIINVLFLLYYLWKKIRYLITSKGNKNNLYLSLFLLINLIKSDSLLYTSSFIAYLALLFITFSNKIYKTK